MSNQLKKIAFLVKRADLGREDFERHWREVHGLVVSRSPGYSRYRIGYAQNHVLGDTPVGRPFPWSGMAEFWLPGDAPNEDDFSTTAIYRERIAVDERRFIDMEETISMSAVEYRLRPGSGPIKVVIVVGAEGAATSDPGTLWAEESILRLGAAVAGWTVNAVLPGTSRRPGARPSADLEIDSVHETGSPRRRRARRLRPSPRSPSTASTRNGPAPSWPTKWCSSATAIPSTRDEARPR